MTLPARIFFTGAPGSRWSAIANVIESVPGMNISDRVLERNYELTGYVRHTGAYFGPGMEFDADFTNVDGAHKTLDGCRLIKSHQWASVLESLKTRHCIESGDWIMMVYRPESICYDWWTAAGGFNITYPNYDHFQNPSTMMNSIKSFNKSMLTFAYHNRLPWYHFTAGWIHQQFGDSCTVEVPDRYMDDILVTLYKPMESIKK